MIVQISNHKQTFPFKTKLHGENTLEKLPIWSLQSTSQIGLNIFSYTLNILSYLTLKENYFFRQVYVFSTISMF